MDKDVSRRIRQLCTNPTSDTQRRVRRALILQAGGSMGIREAKAGFEKAIERARNGVPQIIRKAKDAVVLISIADLTTLLTVEDDPTPINPLEEVGFELLGTRRRIVEERRNRETLKRRAFPGAKHSIE